MIQTGLENDGKICAIEPILYQISVMMSIMAGKQNTGIELEAIQEADVNIVANLKRMRNSLKIISSAIDEILEGGGKYEAT